MILFVFLVFLILVTCGYIAGRDKNYVMYGLLPIMVLLLFYPQSAHCRPEQESRH